MHIGKVKRPWSLQGELTRGTYFAAGVVLLAIKYLVDTSIAIFAFDRPWSFFNYWVGLQGDLLTRSTPQDRLFLVTMIFCSLPFIWLGVALTVRRLRTAGLPLWLVAFFFAPLLNAFVFIVASLAAPRPNEEESEDFPVETLEEKVAAYGVAKSAGLAIGLTAVFGTTLVAFDVYALGIYGAGLFVGLPFSLGLIAAVLHGFQETRTAGSCMITSVAAVGIVGLTLFLLAFEGAICLLMASPICIICAAFGSVIGYEIQRTSRNQRQASIIILAIALAVPVLMGAEYISDVTPTLFEARTEIIVNASAESVWPHVIEFPPLKPPTEWMFSAGIAFPTHATIDGEGVGSERRCNFSTGTFVEPITVWDRPNLLRFDVTENPPPMQEWSLAGDIHPPHLTGFLISQAGEFQLSETGDGQTTLRGTTWYHHNMRPDWYWAIWSDAIIHRIHLRVLNHISANSERQKQAQQTP